MSDRPRVSAIIPSYNHAHYVVGAVESVLAQDFEHTFEVVIIDDGSTDASRALLAPFAEDPRVNLVLQENRGISGTFNRGLELARGEWVGFCNSDDRWLPGHLTAAWANLQANPDAVLSYGRARLIDREGAVLDGVTIFGTITDPDPLAELLRYGNSFCLIATLFRRQDALDAGGFDDQIGVLQDYALWLELLQTGHAVHVLEPTVEFRWDGENASGPRAAVQKRRDLIRVLTRALERYPILEKDQALRAEVTRRLAHSHQRLARRVDELGEKVQHLNEARRLGAPAWRHGLELLKAHWSTRRGGRNG